MSKETKLLKNTAIIAIGNICTKCISFFMLPLYTALLSTNDYGTVDMITTYTSLLVIIFNFQLEQGIFRYLIEARGNRQKQNEYITSVLCFLIAVNISMLVVGGFVLSRFKYQYTAYLLISIFINVFNSVILAIPRGLGDNTTYAIGSCMNGSFQVILNVIFIAYLHFKVEGMLIAGMLAMSISMIYILTRIKLWKYIKISYFKMDSLREIMAYSLPLIPYTLTWWVMSASNRMVINVFLGTSFNGIFAVANKFPSLFSMVTNIFQLSWLESASENVNDEGREKYYQSVMDKTIRFYSSSNLLIIAVIPFVFTILINENFANAYNYIPILMTGAMFHSITALYGSIYFAFKETKTVAKTTIFSAIINVVISLALVKAIGLYAAALATMIANISVTVIRHFDIKRMVNIKISKKYVLSEMLVYGLALAGYYMNVRYLQFIILLMVIPVCFFRNKLLIYSMIDMLKKKLCLMKR